MIRAVIVDDELAAISNLADLLSEYGDVEIVGEFVNPFSAYEAMKTTEVDVVFLDIEMPGLGGLELAGRLLELNKPAEVVFVTAYNEYAVEAFELHVLDYLLKPVNKERLQKTLERISARMGRRVHPPGTILRVRCFGKFRVDQGDGTPVKWRTNKTEELFAFLVDRGGAETRKETIIDLLWEHMDEKRASDNFSTCLYNLKKTLAGLGFPRILMYNGGTLRVDMNQISTDVQEFERWAAAPDRPDASSLQAFREMVARFGEGYMAENYFAWAESRRRQLDEIFVKRIVRAAAREAENGKKAEAAELLKLGLRKDPLDQDLNMALLELYAQMQDKVAAVKHYEAYKKRLDEEYGIEPDGNMRKLVERLLQA